MNTSQWRDVSLCGHVYGNMPKRCMLMQRMVFVKLGSSMCDMLHTFKMKPSGQVSWSYHMALYMSRSSRLVRKAKVIRISPVICGKNTDKYMHDYKVHILEISTENAFPTQSMALSPQVLWFLPQTVYKDSDHDSSARIDAMSFLVSGCSIVIV